MDRWREQGPALAARRQAAVEKVRAQLTGPSAAAAPTAGAADDDPVARDVLACRSPGEAYVLLRVAQIHRGEPIMVLLDFLGPSIPPAAEIAQIPDRQFIQRSGSLAGTLSRLWRVRPMAGPACAAAVLRRRWPAVPRCAG